RGPVDGLEGHPLGYGRGVGACALPAAAWEGAGEVRHTFTHFHLRLAVVCGTVAGGDIADGTWVHPRDFGGQALPTLMKKVAKAALG
ncbi:MAG: NUDIX domain-containing protein, partial [Rhodospirillales bacterium]